MARARPIHAAAGWGTVAGTQLLALLLMWRPSNQPSERDVAVKTAALLPAVAWAPFFAALAVPGTQPNLRRDCPPTAGAGVRGGIPLRNDPGAVVRLC